MTRTVVLVGSLDTKAEEFAFVQELLEAAGVATLLIDFGVLGPPPPESGLRPDIPRTAVAAAGGSDLTRLAGGQHKDEAMQVMARGLAGIVADLHAQGKVDGILGMGGSGGTSIATAAMRALPVGLPKLMLSTLGGGDVSAYTGGKDITFMPSVVDVAGLNRISRPIFANAAGAMAGMVKVTVPPGQDDRPLIAASMFGNTTQAVGRARAFLEKAGYEVLVFHATGTGGRTMETLATDGQLVACLDMTTTELADEVCGGIFSAGTDRGRAAPRAGIPTLLVPGCVDMANFGAMESVPARYQGRNLYQWNPDVTLLRTNPPENRIIGQMLAAAANEATGPVAVLWPRGGLSMLDSPGQRFWDPQADQACLDELKSMLREDIPVYEMAENINDLAFGERAARLLLEMLHPGG